MKIALIRGDFLAPAELANFRPLLRKHEVTAFSGLAPVWDLSAENNFPIVRLPCPVDLNFGTISVSMMALLNRIFTDAHVLFGLEAALSGFDIAHTAETYYRYTQQCLDAKRQGRVSKVVATVWENIPFNNEGIAGRKEFKKRALREVDRFLAVTRGAKESLIAEGGDENKIVVLRPGVDTSLFRPRIVRSFGGLRKNDRVKILLVSRLVPEKGVLPLVEIYQNIARRYPRVELVVAGEGILKKEIAAVPGVTYLGKVAYEDMPRLYALCDILVHYPVGMATWSEQYGMVLVEAMACGLAVVALDAGSIAEVVDKGGLVVDEANFGATLEKVISRPGYRKKMSLTARRFAEKNYDTTVYARNLERIYRELLIKR